MLLFLAFTLALSSVPTEEVSLGINPETSPGMRSALLSDAFSRLDLNKDGWLTKAERKPLFDDSYVLVARMYVTEDEPSTVTKAKFVATVAVPDMADTQDPTEHDCLLEAALVQISADDIWRYLYGDKDSVSVPEFASAFYNAMEKDIPMNLMQFIDALTKPHGRFPFAPNADNEMHIYKLDSYTELHNQKCQSQRRNLFVGGSSFIPIPTIPISIVPDIIPDDVPSLSDSETLVTVTEILAPIVSTSSIAAEVCSHTLGFLSVTAACAAYNAFGSLGSSWYMPWVMPHYSIANSVWNSWRPTSGILSSGWIGRRLMREKMAEAVQRKA